MTTQEWVEYYQNLLIMQYERQPRARATIAAFVGEALADQLTLQVRDGFNLPATGGPTFDSARGKQLDVLAAYRGLARLVYGLNVSRNFFRMPHYGESGADAMPGMLYYGDSGGVYSWLSYGNANEPLYALTDRELTRLIQLRAAQHHSLLSLKQVDDLLFAVFGTTVGVFEDATPMHITYAGLVGDTDTLFDIATMTKSWPRPAGVMLSTERLPQLAHEFGLQIYGQALNTAFVGYGQYGTPQSGAFMRYF